MPAPGTIPDPGHGWDGCPPQRETLFRVPPRTPREGGEGWGEPVAEARGLGEESPHEWGTLAPTPAATGHA